MAVHEEVCIRPRLTPQLASKGKKFQDMSSLRGDCLGMIRLTHVMEAQLEPCVLAEVAKRFRYRPIRVENGQHVADLVPAVARQLRNAADADPERCKGVHQRHSRNRGPLDCKKLL